MIQGSLKLFPAVSAKNFTHHLAEAKFDFFVFASTLSEFDTL
jgi:hypothetical protein